MQGAFRKGSVLFAATVAILGFQAANAAAQSTLTPGEVVDNFRLLDHAGQSHQLYYLSDKKAVVLIAQGNSCAANTKALPEIRKLRDAYGAQQVEFLMINSNLTDKRDQICGRCKARD